jgi:hypothetical protein
MIRWRAMLRVVVGLCLAIGFGLWILTKLNLRTELPTSKDAQPAATSAQPAEPSLTPHQQRWLALRKKQEAAEWAIAIEQEAVKKTLREDGIEGIPADEHERMQRLLQQKQAVDAAIREEEEEGGTEPPPPPPPTVLQRLTHHQMGESFSIGYWTYRCDTARWSSFLGNGSSEMGHPDAAFAVIHLTVRNDDESSSIFPPARIVGADAHEYEPSPKAILQKDALDLVDQLAGGASANGFVVFDVPQGSAYCLKVSGGMVSSKEALIDLAELQISSEQPAPSAQ